MSFEAFTAVLFVGTVGAVLLLNFLSRPRADDYPSENGDGED